MSGPRSAPEGDRSERIGNVPCPATVGASLRLVRWGGLAAAIGDALLMATEAVDLFDTPAYPWDLSATSRSRRRCSLPAPPSASGV